jgi:DNA-binding beta-propeller fold protein YncE
VAAAAHSQRPGSVDGPVWGYVFDEAAGGLRPLLGIPGSATLGHPVELGYRISDALILDASHAVLSTDRSSELLIADLGVSPPSYRRIPDIPAAISVWTTSASGTAAAFYRNGDPGFWVAHGLPAAPVSRFIDLALGNSITRLAISNDGQLALYAVTEGGRETLYSWTPSTNAGRWIGSADAIGGLIVTDRGNAIVADRGTNEVFAIVDPAGNAVRRFLAEARDGVSGPVGLTVSADGRVHVINAGSSTVLTLDVDGRPIGGQSCACVVSRMSRANGSVFRLTGTLTPSTFLFDAGSSTPRILFAPNLPEGQ